MTDTLTKAAATKATASAHGHHAHHRRHRPAGTGAHRSFAEVMRAAASHRPTRPGSTAALSPSVQQALGTAMRLEQVPDSWRSALSFIVAHESGGKVGERSAEHSARGLFQLTAVNYHLNPGGQNSFGNAVEESQGGIRYIAQRYGTADNAAAFWQRHHWY